MEDTEEIELAEVLKARKGRPKKSPPPEALDLGCDFPIVVEESEGYNKAIYRNYKIITEGCHYRSGEKVIVLRLDKK